MYILKSGNDRMPSWRTPLVNLKVMINASTPLYSHAFFTFGTSNTKSQLKVIAHLS